MIQTIFGPLITGLGLTVIVKLALQPKLFKKFTDVVPGATPVTIPVGETVNILLFELVQFDAVPLPVRVIELLTQTEFSPVIVGIGLTVIIIVFEHPVFVT